MADNNENPASPEASSGKKKKKKKTAFDYARAFFIKIGVTAAVIAALLIWVAGVYVCHDNSSYPMIKDGDLCITYKLGSLEQGDAVAYKYGDKIRFGRVIAAGGDEVGTEYPPDRDSAKRQVPILRGGACGMRKSVKGGCGLGCGVPAG